jgi:type II secretory pathway component GspD/PulD (secretin)
VQNPKNTKDQKQKQPTESTTSAYSLLDKNDNDVFIFQGTESEIATLQKLLVQIDTVVPQVVVKGTVYEVQTGHKDGSAFSLAMSVLGNNLAATVGQIIKGDSLTLRAGNIDAVFSALSTDNRFKSISNTSLRVSSGSSARFSVGSDVPVLGAVQTDRNGAAVQSVEYKPSGVIFDLKPTIRDAVIDLAISQQLSSFVTTTTGVNNSPTLIKREISTNVGAVDGDVIVLGGLDDDQTTDDAAGLAFMPPWARSKATEGKKTQILLVLQVQKI